MLLVLVLVVAASLWCYGSCSSGCDSVVGGWLVGLDGFLAETGEEEEVVETAPRTLI